MRRTWIAVLLVAGAVLVTIVPSASATPPDIAITLHPTDPTNSTSASFDFGSATATATFDCTLDGATTPNCVSPFSQSGLTDGPHTFQVTATDAGETSLPAQFTWVVDTTPPSSPTIGAGPNGPTSTTTPTFTFAASATASAYSCSIDDATPTTTCNLLTFTPSALADGPHTFYVTATDAAGNTSSPPSARSFTVTTTAPDTSITTSIAAIVATSTLSIAFTATAPATFECQLDAAAFAPCTSPDALTGLADGTHTFAVRAVDAAANVDATPATATWTVDTTPPVLAGPGSRTVEANGPGGTNVGFDVSGSDGGLALLPGAIFCNPTSGTTFPIGRSGVKCTASDAAGNVATLSFAITVADTTPPVINAPDASFTATSSSGIARTNQAIAAYLARISATDLVSAPTLTTTIPDTLPIGATKIVVTARDAAGNQAQKTATLTVLAPGTPAPKPDFTPPGAVLRASARGGDGAAVLRWIKPTAVDLAAVKIVRSIVGESKTTTVYQGLGTTFTNKGLRNGVAYRFVLVAIDKAGNTSKSVVVTVTPTALLLASPKPGARVTGPPLLRWAPVATAKYFNVQLYRNGKKVLSAWPTVARLQLGSKWTYDNRSYALAPGSYTWYVWPGIGARSAARYGQLIGKSGFVVPAVAVV